MDKTLGTKILELRKENKMTQEELAFKLGVTSQAVSKWENDSCYPDIDILINIADLFGCTLDELFGRQKSETRIVPDSMRCDINKMLLRIKISSEEDEEKTKVNVNLPVSLILTCYQEGKKVPIVEEKLKNLNIDLEQIIMLIRSGVVGNLVEIESGKNYIQVFVE